MEPAINSGNRSKKGGTKVIHVNGETFIEVILNAGLNTSTPKKREANRVRKNNADVLKTGLDFWPHRSYHVDAPGEFGAERMVVMADRSPYYIERVPAVPRPPKILRVAAYARVSTDKDAAFHSLEAQTEYYEAYVREHQDWQLVGIYSDDGISGTVITRPEFQRLLEDCRAGKIDLIITKSITRFARNTVVLLETVRELKKLGIDCYFEKENMHSISPDGELLLTCLALYAEEEARSASENQKWRIRKKFEKGEPWVGRMLGYRLGNGRLEIVPEEAEIVRRIFAMYMSGMSMLAIAKELSGRRIPPVNTKTWSRNSILYILTNEKYTGDMVLQKTYRPDFRTKKDVTNRGQVRKYEVKGSHEAIIPKELFRQAQERIARRKEMYTFSAAESSSHPQYLFTGLITCGECGGSCIHRNAGKGKYKRPVWACKRSYDMGKVACPSQKVPEYILIEKTKEVLGLGAEDALDRELLLSKVKKIIVPEPHQLVFNMKDGTTITVLWQHRSRRESWTPEMREAAREKALAQKQKKEVKE